MPRAREFQLATPVTQQSVTSKPRRPAVKWDHRKDKYMLLAIFAQTNMRAPDFKQLSEMLGGEQYSAETLKKRFRDLEQIATEVMEDRQGRTEDAPAFENVSDDDATLVNEPRQVQITPPSSNNSTPCRRPNQQQDRDVPQEPYSPNDGPAARRRRRKSKNRSGPNSPPSGNQTEIRLSEGCPTARQQAVPAARGGGAHQVGRGHLARAPPKGPAQGWNQGDWRGNGNNFQTRAPNRPTFQQTSGRFHYHENPQITTVSVNSRPIHQYFES